LNHNGKPPFEWGGLLLRLLDDGNQTPALILRQRTCFHNPNPIADGTGVAFVMSLQFIGTLYNFSDYRVLYAVFYCHDDGFVHFVANNPANAGFSKIPLCIIILHRYPPTLIEGGHPQLRYQKPTFIQ